MGDDSGVERDALGIIWITDWVSMLCICMVSLGSREVM